ncbi:hypothetical protein D3C85_1475120 [compost metagenome]
MKKAVNSGYSCRCGQIKVMRNKKIWQASAETVVLENFEYSASDCCIFLILGVADGHSNTLKEYARTAASIDRCDTFKDQPAVQADGQHSQHL